MVIDMRLGHVGMWLSLPQPANICMPREVLGTVVASWAMSTKLFPPRLPIPAHLKWRLGEWGQAPMDQTREAAEDLR